MGKVSKRELKSQELFGFGLGQDDLLGQNLSDGLSVDDIPSHCSPA